MMAILPSRRLWPLLFKLLYWLHPVQIRMGQRRWVPETKQLSGSAGLGYNWEFKVPM